MEPLLIGLIPATLGGLALAFLLPRLFRRRADTVVTGSRMMAPPTINMANIKVEGVGGLGLVAAVLVVAATDPRIRLAILSAAVLGSGLALALIALRRDTGAMPSSTDGPDSSLLGLDPRRRSLRADPPLRGQDAGGHRLATLPALRHG